MKPVFKCEYCDLVDIEEKIRKHEEDCVHNKEKRSCYTCGYRKGWGVRIFGCQRDVEIPAGKYMENCPNWTEDKREFDAKNPYTSLFESFLGKA